ncbi:TetR/AcrR family transcriptional regulator [Primorskyibacter aestuariivivens]|uniref:TetR/AcrR family transcriptional regulator n=1 Tax=Primorskyibacter aestuariivivens TaxID=1888912 RepID=UPI00230179AB|nr:TetR/AcrR family transcriptional regulator [Primorskyibacter aestuariivivens]MDA7428322.1 TetR/AcrR family transcriptional regulator [Primorskyibacter aestuariivivens]
MPRPQATQLRKKPIQARSKATRDAILKAASDILSKDGQEALNTNRVAARAGVSIGALYQYFPNKHAILVTLIGDMYQSIVDDMEAALVDIGVDASAGETGGDLLQTLQALARASQRELLRRPGRTQALERVAAEFGNTPEITLMRTRITAQLVDVLALNYVDAPETIAEDMLAICRALTVTAISRGEGASAELEQRMDRAMAGYFNA